MQAERPHQHTHPPTPQPGEAGRSRNPSPNTHTHTAHPCQEWLGDRSAHTSTHTPQHPSQEWRGAAETRAQTHTPTPRTPARSGGVQTERAHEHTQSPTPQPGVVGRSQNPSPSTYTLRAHPSQEWLGAAETRAHTHTPTPRIRARSGWVQAERAHKHTHTPTPRPGVAGRSRNLSQNTHIHGANPSQEWRGASGAPTPAHTHPNTPARSGGAQPKPEPKHTHPHRAPVPGVAGASGARTRAHTHPNTPARSGGAQPEPEPKHKHPHRAPQTGVAGCKQSAHTSTQTAQHPSQEWRGAAKTRARAHTPSGHTPARSGWAQPKSEPTHTHPHRAFVPGVAGCKRSAHTSTHTPQHPGQEWRGAAGT